MKILRACLRLTKQMPETALRGCSVERMFDLLALYDEALEEDRLFLKAGISPR